MTRQRRYNRREEPVGGIGVLLFLAVGYELTTFDLNQLLASLGDGGLLVTFVFWLVWTLLYHMRRKWSQWAASCQFYLGLTDQVFEYDVAEFFQLQGFRARITERFSGQGIAIYLKENGQQAVVQCKRYMVNNYCTKDWFTLVDFGSLEPLNHLFFPLPRLPSSFGRSLLNGLLLQPFSPAIVFEFISTFCLQLTEAWLLMLLHYDSHL